MNNAATKTAYKALKPQTVSAVLRKAGYKSARAAERLGTYGFQTRRVNSWTVMVGLDDYTSDYSAESGEESRALYAEAIGVLLAAGLEPAMGFGEDTITGDAAIAQMKINAAGLWRLPVGAA